MDGQEIQNQRTALMEQAAAWILNADRLVIGVGSGLSAAGGLCYTDPALVRKWYPEYDQMGLHAIVDIQSLYWRLSPANREKYWGFWARHIWHIRYEAVCTQPYRDLFALAQEKPHFIITTNCDSQVDKAGFSKADIFAPQGNYGYFQCSQPCTQEVYPNKEWVERMVRNMPDSFAVRPQDIPYCPKCGAPLAPNLRCDNTFVEQPHLANWKQYERFIQEGTMQNTVFLELGVGFNTPMIIRYPFETLVSSFPSMRLIRINDVHADVPQAIQKRSISIRADLAQAMRDLRGLCTSPTLR